MIKGDVLETLKDLNLQTENGYLPLAKEGDLCIFIEKNNGGIMVSNQSGSLRSGNLFTVKEENFHKHFALKTN